MASAGRTLAWAAAGILILIAAACADDDVQRGASCTTLDALGAEIEAYEDLLAWPGITARPLQQATDDLEAALLAGDELAADIGTAFESVRAAVAGTIPPSLVEARPAEPAQMAAAFIAVELQPLIQAHALALDERC